MMWNWLVSGLASGATLLLYDGSPFHPDGNVLFDFAEAERMTLFRHVGEVHRCGAQGRVCSRATRMICRACGRSASTGSPLSPESFDFVYDGDQAGRAPRLDLRRHRHRLLLRARHPDRARLCAARSRGRASAWRSTSGTMTGQPRARREGRTRLHQRLPLDAGRVLERSRRARSTSAAYFERFDNVWCHGDFAEWTEHGGMIIHGRSDATLNPGRRTDRHGRDLQPGRAVAGDRRGALPSARTGTTTCASCCSCGLRAGVALDDGARSERIRAKIRAGASPRHVPAKIVAVADIPRTKSGKITELAVRDVVHGRTVKNKEALANPAGARAVPRPRTIAELIRAPILVNER